MGYRYQGVKILIKPGLRLYILYFYNGHPDEGIDVIHDKILDRNLYQDFMKEESDFCYVVDGKFVFWKDYYQMRRYCKAHFDDKSLYAGLTSGCSDVVQVKKQILRQKQRYANVIDLFNLYQDFLLTLGIDDCTILTPDQYFYFLERATLHHNLKPVFQRKRTKISPEDIIRHIDWITEIILSNCVIMEE